ncbi:hypothetical protein M8C21_021271 [Ambrosia artemisiifolia]|uniref:Uncharacterized protein n=1 Tax=Ambrosia artemisiifolia TaxID=4212 RepID=A0AAD5D1D9_AMBAR|nr:hypothetical protein M8C21_021271 [Ambrosia artemisiifolia]
MMQRAYQSHVYRPTMLATALYAMSVMLATGGMRDLRASGYPLDTQHDFIYAFSTLPKHLIIYKDMNHLGTREGSR